MTDPKGPYHDIRTKTFDQIASIYSPIGAGNDVYGTNGSEAGGIKYWMRRLSGGKDISGSGLISGGSILVADILSTWMDSRLLFTSPVAAQM